MTRQTGKCFACGTMWKEYRSCECSVSEEIAAEDQEADKVHDRINANMGYKEQPRPTHTCLSCSHSFVTNAGAVYPGLACQKKEDFYKEHYIDYGNSQVHDDAVCNQHSGLGRTKQAAEPEPIQGTTR